LIEEEAKQAGPMALLEGECVSRATRAELLAAYAVGHAGVDTCLARTSLTRLLDSLLYVDVGVCLLFVLLYSTVLQSTPSVPRGLL
jgi:hypothetical protein